MVRYLLCSFALVLLYPTAIDLYLVGSPQISQTLGASESQLHIAFSVYLAGMATTMLLAGQLADAVGRKPVAIVGAIIFAFASLLGGSAESSEIFFIARFCQGVGAGACYVAAFAILRDKLDDHRRAKVLSMLNGITCIIPVIAPVIGHLIMLKYPWPVLFTTMAGMGGLVCLLSTLMLKETNPHLKLKSENRLSGRQTSGLSAPSESFWERFFVSRVIITSLGVTAILTYVNVSPMLIMEMMDLSRGEYSSIMAITALVSMLTSFSAPVALAWFKQRTLMVVSQSLFVLAAIVLELAQLSGFGHSVTLFGFGLLCAGFAIGFGVAMSQALRPFSFRAGMASSVLAIAQVSSSALYIWLMGVLGVNALNMLVFILAIGGVVSIALISLASSPNLSGANEKITGTS